MDSRRSHTHLEGLAPENEPGWRVARAQIAAPDAAHALRRVGTWAKTPEIAPPPQQSLSPLVSSAAAVARAEIHSLSQSLHSTHAAGV